MTKLLVTELWGIGDLAIATPFLQAAGEKYDVTLLAKPHACDLRERFWPKVKVVPFVAPWTVFTGKYRLWRWPWPELSRVRKQLRSGRFAIGVSGRWDPRDHFLLALVGTKERLGFPRVGSRVFLTNAMPRPDPQAHRYENWRVAARVLGMNLPRREALPARSIATRAVVLVHSGARQPARAWPLERYQRLIQQFRERGHRVEVVCDMNQRDWWLRLGENEVVTPRTIPELLGVIDRAGVFIGNDSGPGHLAALTGIPTFTVGPQSPQHFAPLHPAAEWVEAKTCPYKPCLDYCRFPTPHCLWNVTVEEVWTRVEAFVTRHMRG